MSPRITARHTMDLDPVRRIVCELMGAVVLKSVLDAIREGDWYYEPEEIDCSRFGATQAIPGTQEKLDVLAARARAGLPLWHDGDRADYEQVEQ